MNLKKWISVLLCFAMMLGLAACGTPTEEETTVPSTAAPETQVQIEPLTLTTDADSYTVGVEQMTPITVTVSGGDGEPTVTYASADESVATVNKYGKIIGVSAGTTEITVCVNGEVMKTVSVTVEAPVYENVLKVALNVLYNDTELGCANTEYGPYIEIKEDGQYTVTFDCTTDLSESSRKLGVTGLDHLTAVFLYDHAVRVGDQKASSVTGCNIRWDSVTVNGQELTLTNSEFKSAIKASGIFDTNDPLNAWDGSAVEEVTVDADKHILDITVDDPTTITVTFTIEGLTFAQ